MRWRWTFCGNNLPSSISIISFQFRLILTTISKISDKIVACMSGLMENFVKISLWFFWNTFCCVFLTLMVTMYLQNPFLFYVYDFSSLSFVINHFPLYIIGLLHHNQNIITISPYMPLSFICSDTNQILLLCLYWPSASDHTRAAVAPAPRSSSARLFINTGRWRDAS